MDVPGKRPDRTYTIRQLCNEFGATPRALRFYEDRGLLAPTRNGANRIYSNRDRARLQLILRGKRVGFTLTEIREMLDLYDKDEAHAAQMAVSIAKFRARIAALKTQRVELDRAIEDLTAACEGLEARLAQARPELLPSAEAYDKLVRARVDGAATLNPANPSAEAP